MVWYGMVLDVVTKGGGGFCPPVQPEYPCNEVPVSGVPAVAIRPVFSAAVTSLLPDSPAHAYGVRNASNPDCALYPNGKTLFRRPTHSAAAGKAFFLTEEQLSAAVDFLDPNKDGSVSTCQT